METARPSSIRKRLEALAVARSALRVLVNRKRDRQAAFCTENAPLFARVEEASRRVAQEERAVCATAPALDQETGATCPAPRLEIKERTIVVVDDAGTPIATVRSEPVVVIAADLERALGTVRAG